MKVSELYTYAPKSNIKASIASSNGKYQFYSSSSNEEYRCNDYIYDCKAIIMGTGGNATLHYYEGKFSVSTDCLVLIPNEKVEAKFLYYFFLGNLRILEEGFKGAGLKHTNKKYIDNIDIDELPTLSKQKMIIKQLDRISSILSIRRAQIDAIDKLIRARYVEMFDDKEETCLSNYIESLEAGKSLAGIEECKNKVLKTGAVSYDFFDDSQTKNLPKNYEPKEAHMVRPGDIIISRMNTVELVGAAAYVWNVSDNTYLPDRLWKAIIKDNADPIFVWQSIIQPKTKEQIRRAASGTSGSMKNISKVKFLNTQVKNASLKEQKQFAAFVAQANATKVAAQESLDKIQLLFDSLTQEYFG